MNLCLCVCAHRPCPKRRTDEMAVQADVVLIPRSLRSLRIVLCLTSHRPRRERRHGRLGGRSRSSTFASAQNPGKGGAYDEPFSDSGSRFAMDMPLAGCNALAAFGRRRRFRIGAVGRGCVARKSRALRLGPPRLHRCRSGRHLGSSGLTGFNQAVRSGSYLLSPLRSHADEALRVPLREGRIVLCEPADQVRLGAQTGCATEVPRSNWR